MRSFRRTPAPQDAVDGSRADLRDVLALAAALGVVGASFGALAAAAGIPLPIVAGMSLIVFAGGAQVPVVAGGAGGRKELAAEVGGLLLHARHIPFRPAFWACGISFFVLWNVGTLVGTVAGAAVPDPNSFGIDSAFPAALLALLLPGLRVADARRVGLGAAAVALVATPFLPPGLPVLAGLAGLAVAGSAPASKAAS